MEKYVYLKGAFVKESQAKVSVQERGFRFGDGLFETIRVNNGKLYQYKAHINRLQKGLKALRITYNIDDLEAIFKELIVKNSVKEGFVRLSISRGIGSVGYLPNVRGRATIVVETVDPVKDITEPIDLWLSSYNKIPDSCLPVATKTMQGLNSTLARIEAKENSCFEALLMDIDGKICEGSSSNIFWVKDNVLYTPKSNVLLGTIREAVIRISPYRVIQGDFSINDLKMASEVFMTNVAWLIVPVRSLKPNNLKWSKFEVCKKIRELLKYDIS